jgi:ankyrin repeat protein
VPGLLDAGADVNALHTGRRSTDSCDVDHVVRGCGITLLMLAVDHDSMDNYGYDASRARRKSKRGRYKRNHGMTALIQSACVGRIAAIELMSASGADICHTCTMTFKDGLQSVSQWTALHSACYDGHSGCSKLLILAGCDIAAKDSIVVTPNH